MKIVVGEGSCGIAAGAEKVRQALLKQDLNGAKLTIAGCIGMCYLELKRVTKALYLLFLFQMRIRNF